MRQVLKAPDAIAGFNAWAVEMGLTSWSSYSSPQSPHHTHYLNTRDNIAIFEQSCLSAYTERPLGRDTHIDHFRKRSMYPELTFEYANFLVDDINHNYGACYKDNHAGVTKETFDGTHRIFYPVIEDMSAYIVFAVNGKMMPRPGLSEIETTRVEETIRVFNLNHQTLKSIRSTLIAAVFDFRKLNSFTDDEIRSYLERQGFPSVIEWALKSELPG